MEIMWNEIKTPLAYQMTEYDCGTVTVLNALRYLFTRSELSPLIYKYITQCTLDKPNEKGESCKGGTSTWALELLCKWLEENSKYEHMSMYGKNLPIEDCSIYNKELEETIGRKGVAILRVYCEEVEHYCLLTQLDDKYAYIFDPYYMPLDYYKNDDCCEIITDKPFEFNRKVLKSRIDEKNKKDFSLVDGINKQIVLLEKNK